MIEHPGPNPKPAPPPPANCGFLCFTYSIPWVIFELCFVHSAPMVNSIIELSITDMVFLRKDSKWMFLAGIIYMFCNYWGSADILHGPVYNIPFLNWQKGKEWESWLGYGL